MTGPYLPEGLQKNARMHWIFTEMMAPDNTGKK
jgi:hypothetical protein